MWQDTVYCRFLSTDQTQLLSRVCQRSVTLLDWLLVSKSEPAVAKSMWSVMLHGLVTSLHIRASSDQGWSFTLHWLVACLHIRASGGQEYVISHAAWTGYQSPHQSQQWPRVIIHTSLTGCLSPHQSQQWPRVCDQSCCMDWLPVSTSEPAVAMGTWLFALHGLVTCLHIRTSSGQGCLSHCIDWLPVSRSDLAVGTDLPAII